MAIHPDDPPWTIFGLPRIISNKENLERMVKLVDSPYNGLTSVVVPGVNPENDVPELIRYFGGMGRIHFGHIRNIKILSPGQFHEVSHLSRDGSLDVLRL